jgi:RNA polymerase sigma factor (TIGR02999 family)
MKDEKAGHSLQPTALVHEAYLRIVRSKNCDVTSRTQFLRLAARAMRQILIESARSRNRLKRGGEFTVVSLVDGFHPVSRPENLLRLDDALSLLETFEPQAAQVVEMRFFAGMTEEEIAADLGVSLSTIKREWTFARAWLRSQLDRGAAKA